MFRTGKRCGELILTLMLVLALTPFFTAQSVSHASKNVSEATTLEEFIEATSGVEPEIAFTVDREDGSIGVSKDFESVFDEDFDKIKDDEQEIIETIEDSGEYIVINNSGGDYTVAERYGTCRLIVDEELKSAEDADSAVIFDGATVLKYGSPEKTEKAYEDLSEKYGEENVIEDLPIGIMGYEGWGTQYMNLDKKTAQVEATCGDETVTVAVLDTGINATHEMFEGRHIEQYDIFEATDSCPDKKGHGSSTAGIIAESTPSNVEILAIKTMNDKGVGSLLSILSGISYAIERGADVMNMSFGGYYEGMPDGTWDYVDRYLKEAYDKNIFISVASGNNGVACVGGMIPAGSIYTYSVGAIKKTGKRADFSNYGDKLNENSRGLDFVAPGYALTTANYKSNYLRVAGTSYAAPYIAASAALLKLDDVEKPDEIADELIEICDDLGNEGWDEEYGWGCPNFSNSRKESVVTITSTLSSYPDGYDFSVNGKKLAFNIDNNSMTYDALVGDKLLFEYPSKIISDDKKLKLASLKINGESVDLNKHPTSYEYGIKDKEVLVEFTVKQTLRSTIKLERIKANINVDSGKNGTITIDGKTQNLDEIYVGQPIKVGYVPDKGYEVESVTINGEAVDLSAFPSQYRFRIETEDVDIKVSFVKTATPSKVDLSKVGYTKTIKALPKNGFAYNGKAIVITKYRVPYYEKDGKAYALNYKVSYTRNTRIGTSTATFTPTDKSKFTGTVKTTFRIVPKKPAFKTVKMTKSTSQIKVKAVKGGVKYQYQIRLKGKGKWKTVNSKKTTYKFTKLKGKKLYQIRVRAYKKVGKKTYYSPWNTVKLKTVKKTKKFR